MSTSTASKAPRLATAARLVQGAAFFTFGLNGFLHFLPMPPAPAAAAGFMGALAATGYMFPLIKGTEVATGLLLLGNRFVPLALTLIAPVLVNILAFHTFRASRYRVAAGTARDGALPRVDVPRGVRADAPAQDGCFGG
jgi:hypothetical protein